MIRHILISRGYSTIRPPNTREKESLLDESNTIKENCNYQVVGWTNKQHKHFKYLLL